MCMVSSSCCPGRYASWVLALQAYADAELIWPARPLPRPPAGLHSEQRALVDLLVLVRAEAFVGDSRSSFAGFAAELRALQGLPRSTFFELNKKDIKFFAFAPR